MNDCEADALIARLFPGGIPDDVIRDVAACLRIRALGEGEAPAPAHRGKLQLS